MLLNHFFFDYDFLNIYNKFLLNDKSIHLITADFKKINETDNNLHSLGLLNNDQSLKLKINSFHPCVDYLNSLHYYCFGFLRCFKNINDIQFLIKSGHIAELSPKRSSKKDKLETNETENED